MLTNSYAVKRISMTVKETSKQVAVRIGPPLLSAIERRAQEEHRSLAGMIKHLCGTGLEGRRDERTSNKRHEHPSAERGRIGDSDPRLRARAIGSSPGP